MHTLAALTLLYQKEVLLYEINYEINPELNIRVLLDMHNNIESFCLHINIVTKAIKLIVIGNTGDIEEIV